MGFYYGIDPNNGTYALDNIRCDSDTFRSYVWILGCFFRGLRGTTDQENHEKQGNQATVIHISSCVKLLEPLYADGAMEEAYLLFAEFSKTFLMEV